MRVIRCLALLPLIAWATTARAQTVVCTAADLCPAGGASCVISGNYLVDWNCSLDFTGMDVTLASGTAISWDWQELHIVADSFTIEPGAVMEATAWPYGWELYLQVAGPLVVDGTIDIHDTEWYGARLEADSIQIGGTVSSSAGMEIEAVGDVTIDGSIVEPGGNGVSIVAGGALTVNGSTTNCCDPSIYGTGGGGDLWLAAGTDLTLSSTSVIDQSPSQPGGRDVTLEAGGSIVLDGSIDMDGIAYMFGTPYWTTSCFSGGTLTASAGTDLTVGGSVLARGSDVCPPTGCAVYALDPGCTNDSSSGALDLFALGDVSITGDIDTGATTASLGTSSTVFAGGQLSFAGTWDAPLSTGGSVELTSGAGDVTVTGVIGSANELSASVAAPSGVTTLDGTTWSTSSAFADGCTLDVIGTSLLDSSGDHTLWFRDLGLVDTYATIAGSVAFFEHGAVPPTILGSVTPAPVLSTTAPACAPPDGDGDGVANAADLCPGFDDTVDSDGDGIPDGCDPCADADGDGVCDTDDACPGFDDTLDADLDGQPDDCDPCPASPFGDSDGDGSCDAVDPCPYDPDDDLDGDGVCGDQDLCPGFDDTLDTDLDGQPDGCDPCPNDPDDDLDGDGVCGDQDLCPGFDDGLDSDGDLQPDGCDPCPADAPDDTDGDGACDSDDPCPADADDDSDGDGSCDSDDVCPGFDDTADTDSDGVPDGCDPCPLDRPDDSDGDGICDADDACIGTCDTGRAVDEPKDEASCGSCDHTSGPSPWFALILMALRRRRSLPPSAG